MGFFSQTIAAAVRGDTVRRALLVELDFADGPGRYWTDGAGPLVTLDGKTWDGTGALLSISEIESAIGDTAPNVTLSLSGVEPALLPELLAAETQVKGRDATIYHQYFDETWTPLDLPLAVFPGLMDVMSIKMSVASATISLSLEGLFTRRGVPPWGYLSNEAQQRRYPGDTGLSEMASMRNATSNWPTG